jgi:hypothetical protein
MNIKQLPDGAIEDDRRPDVHVEQEAAFSYERSNIEQHFIDECERKAEESGETHFLFDTKLSRFVKRKNLSKEDKRESDLSEILEIDAYYIGTETDFSMMPSRFSYYDTETKLSDRYEKYSLVVEFIKSLGFVPSEFNLGPEMEQAYILETREGEETEKFVIRLQPNLFLKLMFQNEGFETIYSGFFSIRKIFEAMQDSASLSKNTIRESKIKNILS